MSGETPQEAGAGSLHTWKVGGVSLELDPVTAERQRELRLDQFHGETVPIFRMVGMVALVGVTIVHQAMRGGLDWGVLWPWLAGLFGYGVSSCVGLMTWVRAMRKLKAEQALFALDMVAIGAVIHVTGGPASALFFLPLLCVVQHTYVSLQRTIVFAAAAPLVYLCATMSAATDPSSSFDKNQEIVKYAALFLGSGLLVADAFLARRLRRRTREAVSVAKNAIMRIKRKSQELVANSVQAEEASRMKGMFLANISHEIRTPMNGILGMTELALQTELTEEQADYLSTVRTSGESLLRIINDVLDFSKIEAGKFDLQHYPFSLRKAIGDSLRAIAVKAHDKQLELVASIGPSVPDRVMGDPVRLGQVITNLVGNAIKFTEDGDVIVEVNVSTMRDGETTLSFAVIDTGIGISDADCKRIFRSFTQVDGANSRRFGGTGLGLAISYQLVELMGGRLRVESRLGEGSKFHFHANFELQPGGEVCHTAPATLRDGNALIVTSHSRSGFFLVQLMESVGLSTRLARDMFVARDFVESSLERNERITVVVVDASSLRSRGVDLLREIQQRLTGVPVVALTDSAQTPAQAKEMLAMDLSRVIMKPVIGPELLNALHGIDSPRRQVAKSVAKSKKRKSARPLRLLLAEDNPVNQKLACVLLRSWGHTVEVADDGSVAVKKYGEAEYDLILMDIQMPGMDGIEATKEIRRLEADGRRHMPIFAMTANAMSGDRERCIAAGMDEYVSKPIDPTELFDKIEMLSERPSQARRAG